jgi:hypothetical protein
VGKNWRKPRNAFGDNITHAQSVLLAIQDLFGSSQEEA